MNPLRQTNNHIYNLTLMFDSLRQNNCTKTIDQNIIHFFGEEESKFRPILVFKEFHEPRLSSNLYWLLFVVSVIFAIVMIIYVYCRNTATHEYYSEESLSNMEI